MFVNLLRCIMHTNIPVFMSTRFLICLFIIHSITNVDTQLHQQIGSLCRNDTFIMISAEIIPQIVHHWHIICKFITLQRCIWGACQVPWTPLDFMRPICPNKPDAQIPQCIRPISHNASFCNRNVHMYAHFCYKMMYCVIFDALWDLWDGSIGTPWSPTLIYSFVSMKHMIICCFSGKLWYLQHKCVGDTILNH